MHSRHGLFLLMRDSALVAQAAGRTTRTPEPELEVTQAILSKWGIFFASERKLKCALNSGIKSAQILMLMENRQLQSKKSTFQQEANPTVRWPLWWFYFQLSETESHCPNISTIMQHEQQ